MSRRGGGAPPETGTECRDEAWYSVARQRLSQLLRREDEESPPGGPRPAEVEAAEEALRDYEWRNHTLDH